MARHLACPPGWDGDACAWSANCSAADLERRALRARAPGRRIPEHEGELSIVTEPPRGPAPCGRSLAPESALAWVRLEGDVRRERAPAPEASPTSPPPSSPRASRIRKAPRSSGWTSSHQKARRARSARSALREGCGSTACAVADAERSGGAPHLRGGRTATIEMRVPTEGSRRGRSPPSFTTSSSRARRRAPAERARARIPARRPRSSLRSKRRRPTTRRASEHRGG